MVLFIIPSFLARASDMRNRYSALSTSYSVNWSIASSMSSKFEPVIWLRDTGHIGIHGGADVRTYVCTYVFTDVHDVMAIKPNFLTSMGYHIFLAMVLRARAHSPPLIFPLYVVYSREYIINKSSRMTGYTCRMEYMRLEGV